MALALGLRHRPMEDESDGFQTRLEEFLGGFKTSNPRSLLLDRHEKFPESIHFLHLNHKN